MGWASACDMEGDGGGSFAHSLSVHSESLLRYKLRFLFLSLSLSPSPSLSLSHSLSRIGLNTVSPAGRRVRPPSADSERPQLTRSNAPSCAAPPRLTPQAAECRLLRADREALLAELLALRRRPAA